MKNILLALDPDEDTPIAIDYACHIAHLHKASVTGITVVDTRRIEKQASGGGIGSMYYAEKLKEKWTVKTRAVAKKLIDTFADTSTEAHIPFQYKMKEGRPSDRILEEMRYHDILIVGNSPHFFYVHPEEKTTTLTNLVKKSIGPVLIVPAENITVDTVLVAFDGSTPASRAMQRFAQMKPFGVNGKIHVVHVYEKGQEDSSELMLNEASTYLNSWGFDVDVAGLRGDDHHAHLMQYAEQVGAGLIVAGAHSVSKVSKIAFGSTTASLIEDRNRILFLER